MRISTLLLLICLLLSATTAFAATSYTGSLSSGAGLQGTGSWASGVTFSWLVTQVVVSNDLLWRYYYTLETTQKGISHVLIEASDFFTLTYDPETKVGIYGDVGHSSAARNGADYTTWVQGLTWDTFTGTQLEAWNGTDQGNSNPSIPGELYGLKLDTPQTSNWTTWSFTFDTPVDPVWGDFYAKDGKTGEFNAVWNTGFEAGEYRGIDDPQDPPADGPGPLSTSGLHHILRPDTEGGGGSRPVPQLPPALLLSLVPTGLAIVRSIKRG